MDRYQQRYEAHQARKASVLRELLLERHSERAFADKPVEDDDLALVMDAATRAASSCDRRGVSVRAVRERDDKALLGGLLVGGVGWVHRAPVLLMLFADPLAYKAPGEVVWMPPLDAGVMVGQMYLACAASGLACCFINPNVRARDLPHFRIVFGSAIYCGALAVGWSRSGPA